MRSGMVVVGSLGASVGLRSMSQGSGLDSLIRTEAAPSHSRPAETGTAGSQIQPAA